MKALNNLLNQCAHPKGGAGRFMLKMMNIGHSSLYKWGLSFIPVEKNWRVLDIGCGGGAMIKRMLKAFPESSVYGIDISDESVKKTCETNKSNIGTRCFVEKGNVSKLPFAGNTFDLITAIETIYFWKHLSHAFMEVGRVLKPHARFLICLETDNENTKWENIIEGMTVYNAQTVKDYLLSTGFGQVDVHRKGRYVSIVSIKK